MTEEHRTRLLWHGNETIEKILRLIQSSITIEIDLPVDYHHAIYSKLHPNAEQGLPEVIDISGGPELLDRIATIKGLESLKSLVIPLSNAQATVQLSDPSRIMVMITQ